ncbi:hypothetical protein LSH36_895g01032, partial [Paralvinella palmiformis]
MTANVIQGLSSGRGQLDLVHVLIPTVIVFFSVMTSALLLYFCIRRRWKKTKGCLTSKMATNPLYCSLQSSDHLTSMFPSHGVDDYSEKENYEINPANLILKETLGEGAFGRVLKGELLQVPSWISVEKLPTVVA